MRDNAVPIDSFARHAIQTLRDIGPLHLQRGPAAALDPHGRRGVAEEVWRVQVAVTRYEKVHVAVPESGFVQRDDALAVADETRIARCAELDQRDTSVRTVVHHLHDMDG